MSALLELIREAPPEDKEEIAKQLKPYLFKKEKPQPTKLLNVKTFHQELYRRFGILKRHDWIRNDMFAQCPELKKYAYGLNTGKGHPVRIDEKALDWIGEHRREIDWRG